MMKKFIYIAAIICLSNVCLFSEIKNINNHKKAAPAVNSSSSKPLQPGMKINVKRYLEKARDNYIESNLQEAEKYVNTVLYVENDNLKAQELKNKILMLKEKIIIFKRELVNDYLIEVRRTVKEGNYYEGFLFLNRIEALMPGESDKSSYIRLMAERDMVANTLENEHDRKNFLKSVADFENEEFSKASNIIYNLSQKHPKFVTFVGMSRFYTVQETNNSRVNMYYSEALKNMKRSRYGKAKDYIELGFSLQPNNLKLKILMEQINMELM